MNIFSKTYHQSLNHLIKTIVPNTQKSKYIIFKNTFAYTKDIQKLIRNTYRTSSPETRVVAIYFNFLWKPLLDLASLIGLRSVKEPSEPNWLSTNDVDNLFLLENFEKIKGGKNLLFPFPGKLFLFLNRYLSHLPLIENLCLITYQIYKPITENKKYSVSLIIPARNEAGNIKGILNKIPKIGNKIEVIFIEGHSTDDTYSQIRKEIVTNKISALTAYLYKQNCMGKKDPVKLGFSKARNEILLILDADLTVKPSELTKFYNLIASNRAELAIGSRLVYPMEKQAMRLLNYLGNKFFSLIFSFIIDQKIKDTLCGTKAVLRKNYELIKKNQKYFGNFDPFGDFDLIFGAAKLNFKITEIPVRYGQRTYGTTNISRFRHGLLLAKMAIIGASKIKFI